MALAKNKRYKEKLSNFFLLIMVQMGYTEFEMGEVSLPALLALEHLLDCESYRCDAGQYLNDLLYYFQCVLGLFLWLAHLFTSFP